MDITITVSDELGNYLTGAVARENARLGTNLTLNEYVTKLALNILTQYFNQYVEDQKKLVEQLFKTDSQFRTDIQAAIAAAEQRLGGG